MSKRKFVFEVLCRWCLEPDKIKSELFTATSPDEAIHQAVIRWGRKSTYELRLTEEHPWVVYMQGKEWLR